MELRCWEGVKKEATKRALQWSGRQIRSMNLYSSLYSSYFLHIPSRSFSNPPPSISCSFIHPSVHPLMHTLSHTLVHTRSLNRYLFNVCAEQSAALSSLPHDKKRVDSL